MNPHLLIGCPVFRREWILPAWFSYAEGSCREYGVEPEYLFVCSRKDPSRDVIKSNADTYGRIVHFVDTFEQVDDEGSQHAWGNPGRLEKMVQLRNYLLSAVRVIEPHMFLSLDSDILCHPQQISNLVETLTTHCQKFAAVGGKVFLGPGKDLPSWANYNRQTGMKRYDVDYVFEVDVIMALKLMSPEAYFVDYVYDHNGEDIGWSLACDNRGLKLGFDGRVASKHVMDKKDDSGADLIQKVDSRVGF